MRSGKKGTTRSIFREAWRDAKRRWKALLAADVAYKLLSIALLTPLVGVTLRIGMYVTGRQVLADQDIALFFVRPFGLALVIVVAALYLSLLALELACLMAIGLGTTKDLRVGVLDAMRFVFEHFRVVFGVAIRIVLRCLPYLAVFAAGLAGIYLLLLSEYDINYYLSEDPPAFVAALVLAGLLLYGLAWLLVPKLIGWGLALPLVLFEDVRPGAALAESTRRVSGHRPEFARALILWGLGSVALGVAVPSILFAIGRVIAPFGKGNVELTLTLMLAIGTLWLIGNAIIGWVQGTAFALVLVQLYERFGGGAGVLERRQAMAKVGVSRTRISATKVFLGLAAFAAASASLGAYHLQRVQGNDDVVIIAHRGAAASAPENTLASIRAAIDEETDFVEIDVQETADGEIAVVHDSDLMKVAGEDVEIWTATWNELREIDIGSRFAPEFSTERVPSLREALEAVRGKARLTIELKDYGHGDRLEERVVALVEELGMADQVVVMSLKYDLIQKMRALRPDWTLGLLTATAVGDLTGLDADFLAISSRLANRRLIQRAHAKGKEVYVWTVDDPVQMFRMMNLGVDGLITNRPGLARAVLERRARLSSAQRLLVGIAFHFGASAKDPPVSEDL